MLLGASCLPQSERRSGRARPPSRSSRSRPSLGLRRLWAVKLAYHLLGLHVGFVLFLFSWKLPPRKSRMLAIPLTHWSLPALLCLSYLSFSKITIMWTITVGDWFLASLSTSWNSLSEQSLALHTRSGKHVYHLPWTPLKGVCPQCHEHGRLGQLEKKQGFQQQPRQWLIYHQNKVWKYIRREKEGVSPCLLLGNKGRQRWDTGWLCMHLNLWQTHHRHRQEPDTQRLLNALGCSILGI